MNRYAVAAKRRRQKEWRKHNNFARRKEICLANRKVKKNYVKIRQEQAGYKKRQTRHQRVQEIITQLIEETNHIKNNFLIYLGVIHALSETSRTYQRNVMQKLVKAIVDFFAYKYERGFYDARNKESCKIGAEMKKIMDKYKSLTNMRNTM